MGVLSRRQFISAAAGLGMAGGTVSLGAPRALSATLSGPIQTGAAVSAPAERRPRFGPLSSTPDTNGFLLPPGFSSKVIARSGQPVGTTGYVFPDTPDGAGVIPRDDGGWWLMWNSEVASSGGGTSALRFDAAGAVVEAKRVLAGSNRACAGGVTPWGTWLACEEVSRGRVFEVDSNGLVATYPNMGVFNHEAAAVDAARQAVYLSEDEPDGLFYRYRFDTPGPGRLTTGALEAAVVDAAGNVTWTAIPDPSAEAQPCRKQIAATPFAGGEGLCIVDNQFVYLTTKHDNRVWRYDTVASHISVVYEPTPGSVLSGVDNITSSPGGDLLVCEDGGNMELVAIEQEFRRVTPVLRLTGQASSELTGVCLSPDGRRLYLCSQRAISSMKGIVYEIRGPFPW